MRHRKGLKENDVVEVEVDAVDLQTISTAEAFQPPTRLLTLFCLFPVMILSVQVSCFICSAVAKIV